jgi:hypothetical protein
MCCMKRVKEGTISDDSEAVKATGPSPFLYLHAQSRRKVQLRFRLQGVDDVGCETCVLVAITTYYIKM